MDLVDPNVPVHDRVAQALQNGPGVQELEGLLALIQRSTEQAKGPGKYLPVFEMRMIEGGFGTGPGDQQTWDNRWDLGLQARWNLMELVTAGDRQRLVQAKTEQAHLAYQDLRGKLTAGVQEALEAIVSGKKQMRFAQEQVQEARQAYDLSEKRQQNFIQGSTYSEVLLSLESVALAQASYLHSIRDYDKAQLRLLLLLGTPAIGNGNCSNGGVRQQ
jgi:outer membrane protein TolC